MTWDAMQYKLYSSMYIMHLCEGIHPGSVKSTAGREGRKEEQPASSTASYATVTVQWC